MDADQKLAGAVLRLAFRDSKRPHVNNQAQYFLLQNEARHFLLQDEEIFPFWCHMAGLDPDTVRQRARKIVEGNQKFEERLPWRYVI